jgi:hypothetical protein
MHQAKWKRFHVNMRQIKIFTKDESKLISLLGYSKYRKTLYKSMRISKEKRFLTFSWGEG